MTLCQFQTQALKSLEASTSDGKECACNAGDSVRSLDQEDPLEKGMATHSSILAWKIPRTEERVSKSIALLMEASKIGMDRW